MNTKIAANPHLNYQDWSLTETQFNSAQLNYEETVFTIGNGYLSTRGSFEEGYPGEIPATLINGVYDDIPLFYTELVNCPDWLSLRITIDGIQVVSDYSRLRSSFEAGDRRVAV